jgi:maltose alpha-D-glucosyltransferase/alpha-amylase
MPPFRSLPESDPLWFKDAIIYEVHVRAFADTSGDGMGDFAGLTQKLDYLRDLGVTAIWVLPFCPSPWRDDGYDISDYTNVHPAYGTLKDFQTFLKEAHARGLRVITELVLNHTSDQHVWFQRSRRAAPGSRWRNYYVWSDSPDLYADARIIFKDFEASNWTWDPVARAYFWHRFYSHQPDLNYDNPEVRQVMLDAVDFWLDQGVDGLRLDAVPYLFEREGTNCENLPETHQYLKELRAHIDSKYHGRLLLAEANQWPEDAIAYFGNGDECHMAFQFPLMPRLFMATRMEDRYPITDILQLTPPIPDSCQWALFLRNHDELTLEMVTDEERDYMYRVYAHDRHMRINLGIRRRLAPLLENDRRRIELMNALLFSMPGTPVLYYGDEIGMGDNFYLGDRNGVRTPMQWSGDRNAGFSRANPQRLYLPAIIDPEYHYETINVETQQNNPHSLLWWTKRILAQRQQLHAMGRGTMEMLYPDNRRVLAFVRSYENERVLVVANLSRFAQATEIDLAHFAGYTPLELFGRSTFPVIADRPYFLSLGPHAFYWFLLQPKEAAAETFTIRTGAPPTIVVDSWDPIFTARTRLSLERQMPGLLRSRRWFRGKNRPIRGVVISDVFPLGKTGAYLMIIRVEYGQGDPEFYTIAVGMAIDEEADRILAAMPDAMVARLQGPEGHHGIVYSGLRGDAFGDELLGAIVRRRRLAGEQGELRAAHTRNFRLLWGEDRPPLPPTAATADQENSTLFYGDRFALKLYRKIEEGPHPEEELLSALARAGFSHVPPVAGSIVYHSQEGESMTVALLAGYVRGATELWDYTMHHLGLYYERALAEQAEATESYEELIRQLGRRTAEMHIALASAGGEAFTPEPFTDLYRHSHYHGLLGHAARAIDELRQRQQRLPDEVRADAAAVLKIESAIRAKLQALRDRRFAAVRTRTHGDYHLGQVLYTGKDFVLIDFEGDPGRPLSERRLKRSPLRDVATMLDSFYHAAHGVLYGETPGVIPRPESMQALEELAKVWYGRVSTVFVDAYLGVSEITPLLPAARDQLQVLLDIYRLDAALNKLTFQLTHTPERIRIPAHAILELMEKS